MRVFFPEVKRVQFEGRQSKNPLAFRYYNPEQVIGGKTMAEHLRFSMAYWHTMTGTGRTCLAVGRLSGLGTTLATQWTSPRRGVCQLRVHGKDADTFLLLPRY